MTEQFKPSSSFDKESQRTLNPRISEMISQIRADIDEFVSGVDVRAITHRVEEFGKHNPVGLAFTALTIGIATGLLMKNPKTFTKS